MSPRVSSIRTACLLAVSLSTAVPLLGLFDTVSAQDAFAVQTKVNDAAITGYDIAQRAKLLGLENPGRSPEQLQRQALQALIDDELKLQEAKRRSVEISEEDMNGAIAGIAQRNNMTNEELLADLRGKGVDPAVFEKLVRADLAWNQLLRARYRQRATPTEAEIDAAMEDEQRNNATTRYDVQQIVIDLRPGAPRGEVRKAMTRATEARRLMTSCEELPELAKNYSRLSGRVGLLAANQMPKPVSEAVVALPIGGVTDPLRSQDGLHLVMLCGKEAGESSARRGQIYDQLLNQKISGYSQNYLEDLRREAIIESRS